jgi:predicted acylesterase/phospholipase RssA
MEIATAMRISMSIPVIFQPVMMDRGGETKVMMDGGMAANLASHIVNPYASGGEMRARVDSEPLAAGNSFAQTMVVGFADQGRSRNVLFQKNKASRPSLVERIVALLFTKNLARTMGEDDERFHEAGPGAVLLPHGELDTTTFDASEPIIKAAQLEAEARFLEQLRRNGLLDKDRAMHMTYDTPEAAAASMSEKDLRAFYASRRDLKGDPKDYAHERLAHAARMRLEAQARESSPAAGA